MDKYTKKKLQRDLNPHAEAIFAMVFYGERYSKQGGGSMSFWDRLSSSEKRFCTEQVKKIKQARSKHTALN